APANCFLEVLDTLRCLPMKRVMRFRINPFVRERKLNAPGESPVNAAFSWLRSAGNAARGVAAGERVPGSAATASQRFRVPAPFAPGIFSSGQALKYVQQAFSKLPVSVEADR